MSEKLNVKIKRLSSSSKTPQKAHEQDAGFDLFAVSKEVVDEGDYGFIEYDTGIGLEIPENHVGMSLLGLV